MRIRHDQPLRVVEPRVECGERLRIDEVPLGATGNHSLPHELHHAVEDRHPTEGQARTHAAAGGHFVQMPEQTEPGDIGGRMDADVEGGARRTLVQRGHDAHGTCDERRGGQVTLDGRGNDAHAQRLREQQAIAGAGGRVAQNARRMHQAGDRHAVFRFLVVDAVATDDADIGFARLVRPATQDLAEHRHRERLGGEGHDVQRQQRRRPHRVDVADGVGGRNLSVLIRVVDQRRDVVHGLRNRQVGRQSIHRRVVGSLKTNQQVRVTRARQLAEDLNEILGTDLASSTGAVAERGQPQTIACTHGTQT